MKFNFEKRFFLLLLVISATSCNPQNKAENAAVTAPTSVSNAMATGSVFGANPTAEMDDNIRSIFQDKTGIYWFGTNAAGVYRYDPKRAVGKTITQFTEKDGLADNQIQSIQEDKAGNIWLGTGRFGVSRYDGKTFTTFTAKENLQVSHSDQDWEI
ncbi:MAG: two-component regulator propeller domain-containing protein [Spirosomataceae bacterium]